jgi:hypothetical protein
MFSENILCPVITASTAMDSVWKKSETVKVILNNLSHTFQKDS